MHQQKLQIMALVGSLVIAVSMGACRDSAPTRAALQPRGALSKAIALRTDWRNFAITKPKATPWISMSASQLAIEIGKVHGRVMIGFKMPNTSDGVDRVGHSLVDAATFSVAKAQMAQLGLNTAYEFAKIPAIVATMAPTANLVTSIRSNPYVDYIEPDVTGGVSSQITPWNMTRVQAPLSWGYSTGSGVKLLIIDTGVGPHEDLNVAVAYNCLGGILYDAIGHGTAMGGIAAALNNSLDVVGAGPGVALWSANAWDPSIPGISAAQVACSIDVARVNRVFAVNMSFHLDNPSTTVTNEIVGGYSVDSMLFVAAAGNNSYGGDGHIDYPATLAEVIAVAATNYNNVRSTYSSVGAKIELSAPADSVGYGDGILTTALPNMTDCSATVGTTMGYCSGTSAAAPHVAAGAAVLRAYSGGAWSNVVIRYKLDSMAVYLGDPTWYGNGLVRVYDALRFR
jgi:subtilisin